MEENALLGQLEEVARALSIEIRYEIIKKDGRFYPGGLCRIKGNWLLIIHSKANTRDKIKTLAKALNRFDLSEIYLKPGLREYLSTFQEEGRSLENK
ncbi:MAG: hypothetical protein JRF57_04560 [Deltaproteobacteria bacterium]|nr:hypothetical protein [Deltaproteobacteria bacterium]